MIMFMVWIISAYLKFISISLHCLQIKILTMNTIIIIMFSFAGATVSIFFFADMDVT